MCETRELALAAKFALNNFVARQIAAKRVPLRHMGSAGRAAVRRALAGLRDGSIGWINGHRRRPDKQWPPLIVPLVFMLKQNKS